MEEKKKMITYEGLETDSAHDDRRYGEHAVNITRLLRYKSETTKFDKRQWKAYKYIKYFYKKKLTDPSVEGGYNVQKISAQNKMRWEKWTHRKASWNIPAE